MAVKPTDGVTVPTLATEEAANMMQAEIDTVTGRTEASNFPRTFTEDDIADARRQEKDKLYSKIEKMEEQLRTFNEEREAARREAEALAEAEARARREREEAEMSTKDLLLRKEDEWRSTLNTAQQEWETKFTQLQAEADARQALLDQERRYQEIESYKSRRIAEEQDNLMPELLHMVKGNSIEEIDSAIQTVAATTSAILQSIQQSAPQPQQRPRGISPVGGTPIGPMENATEQQVLTDADIASLSMDQYAQIRDRLLASASRRGR